MSSAKDTCSTIAARWMQALRFEDIPAKVVADAKLRLLDTLGVTLAASAMPVGDVARRASLKLGSGSESRILGFGDRTSAASAAVANGTMAHALDYDDTHNESVIHVSGPVVTAALAVGEARKASGQELITNIVGGSELTCRLGVIAPGKLHERGFHATGVFGTFGAALVAGRILGLDWAKIRHAMGIAGSQAAGILEFFSDGTWAKRLHPGWAAHGGIAAAYLAEAGFTGPASVFEGRYGLLRTHSRSEDFKFERVGAGLGKDWEYLKISYKPYPCGHVIHPFLDALLALQREHGLKAKDVSRITCPIAEWMIQVVCEPRAAKIKPESDYHAKFSLPFALAAALKFGRLGVEAYSDANIADRELLDLAARTVHVVDKSAPDTRRFRGTVIVEMKDGRRLERTAEDNWGSEANPMTPDQVRTKFVETASLALPKAKVEAAIALIDKLETCKDVGKLVDTCVRA